MNIQKNDSLPSAPQDRTSLIKINQQLEGVTSEALLWNDFWCSFGFHCPSKKLKKNKNTHPFWEAKGLPCSFSEPLRIPLCWQFINTAQSWMPFHYSVITTRLKEEGKRKPQGPHNLPISRSYSWGVLRTSQHFAQKPAMKLRWRKNGGTNQVDF